MKKKTSLIISETSHHAQYFDFLSIYNDNSLKQPQKMNVFHPRKGDSALVYNFIVMTSKTQRHIKFRRDTVKIHKDSFC